MKEMALPFNLPAEKTIQEDSKLVKSLNRWMVLLFSSAFLGISTGLVGLIIGAISLIGFPANNLRLVSFGTWLIVAAFPLLVIAAHSLDKVNETDKAIRLEHCRRLGLKDEEC